MSNAYKKENMSKKTWKIPIKPYDQTKTWTYLTLCTLHLSLNYLGMAFDARRVGVWEIQIPIWKAD
jgi:hypothetical protein